MNRGRDPDVQIDGVGTTPGDTFVSDREDERMVLEFLGGRKEALGDLFRKHRDGVFKIAYRLTNNREDALEVTQDVFMKLIGHLGGFRRGARFFTWLYRVAVNQSLDYLRRRQRATAAPLDDQGVQVPAETPDPVRGAERAELSERLNAALGRLSEKHREVVVLHGIEQLSYKEIAEITGASLGTVMSRLFYARKRLTELLEEK